MTITVNGQPQEVSPPLTVAELLRQMKLEPRGVAVELNRDVVPRTHHAEQQLHDGDELEIVTLVGGG